MYWFRGSSLLSLLPWVISSLLWVIGGWLIATHAFRLERRERLLVGIGLGLSGYLWSVNALGHWLAPELAFLLGSVIVLLAGAAFAWRGQRPVLDPNDLREWPLLLVTLAMIWLFARIGRGTTLFDEWKNLSLISTMGAGDIPPHFYMNSGFYFMYHYGFQLFGASLMRLGNMLPWSAYDFSKAVVGALSISTAYLVGKRTIQNEWGGLAFAGVFTFATGTRYLLLLLPQRTLSLMDTHIAFVDGTPFSKGLIAGWMGEPDIPFPFLQAFLNGIQSWPRFMSIQAGPNMLALLILLLVWLAYSRARHPASAIVFAVLFSLMALTWESSYVLVTIGGIAAAGYHILRSRSLRGLSPMEIGLGLSIPVAAIQGGSMTEILRKALFPSSAGASLSQASTQASGLAGFSLRWPPAIPSSHLTLLHLTSPTELLVAICEMGPIIFLIPWVTLWAWRRFRSGDQLYGLFLVSAWVGFLVPIFFLYQNDRDVTRLMAYSLFLWTLLLVILLFDTLWKRSRLFGLVSVAALSLMVYGGLIVSGISLAYASQSLFGRGIEPMDTYIAGEYWDKLEPKSLIFDPRQWRAVALTGRLTDAALSTNQPAPEWQALYDNPTIPDLLKAGYSYVYVDEIWWRGLQDRNKDSLNQPCVKTLSSEQFKLKFRRLLDIRACQP